MKKFTVTPKNFQIRANSGFTLIELLVVIAIIAILVSIVVVALDPVALIGRSNDSKDRSDAQQIKNALQLYLNDHDVYPDEAVATDQFNASCPDVCLTPEYMREIPAAFDNMYTLGTDTGEYRFGVELSEPDADDISTSVVCDLTGLDPDPGWWQDPNTDPTIYVSCPD